jgi:L-asparaginase
VETDPLPHVSILAMGGTIAGRGASPTQTTDYEAGVIEIQEVIKSVPTIESLARVSGEQVANATSYEITNELLLMLARRTNEVAADSDVNGIVITHGSDTLEETAYFLNLVVQTTKPLVVTAAMRPPTCISADGAMNLLNAVRVAVSPEACGRGVLVSMNDKIAAARYVFKASTMGFDAFRTADQGFVGRIAGEGVYFECSPDKRHTARSEFDIGQLLTLPEVAIIYGHEGDGSYFYEAAVSAGVRGIVVAGTGNGNLSAAARRGARHAQAHEVVVVRSSRTGSGIVTPSDLGVAADSLAPAKARILLMLALTQTSDPARIQQMFHEY